MLDTLENYHSDRMDDEDSFCDSLDSSASSAGSPGPTPVLPPCRVCGEKASGFHYGVNTCEACKGFFRRSLQRKEKNYKCSGSKGKCEIGPGKRNSCPACRYNKCKSVGMSKGAIKTGRYTHEKRTKDTLEVKKLQELERHSASPGLGSLSPSSIEDSPHPHSSSPEPQQEDFESLIKVITEAHDKHINSHAYVPMELLEQKQKEYSEQFLLKEQMFGQLSLLPKEEYDEIFRTTGIDIDNRQEMMRFFAANMELGVRRFINFAKNIPGFSELAIEDQANLIKASRFEYWFFGCFRGLNSELQVAVMPSGKTLHLREIEKIWDVEFVKEVFKFANTVKKLDLLPEEFIILKAVVVMFRDRCELKDPDKVERIQWRLINCLLYMLEKNHPGERKLFHQVSDCMIGVRGLTEWNSRLAKDLHIWQAVRDSPLLLEILTI